MPVLAGTLLSVASFLAFGALLVLYGANSSEMIAALSLDYADLAFWARCCHWVLGVGIVLAGPLTDRLPRRPLYIALAWPSWCRQPRSTQRPTTAHS